jgi:hypothetical protein
LTLTQPGIKASERSAERDHCTDDVLRNAGLMAVRIRQIRARPQSAAVNAIDTRAGHLHQTEPRRSVCHARGESHRDQYVHVTQTRNDGSFLIDHYLTRQRQPCPHGFRDPRRE